MAGFAALCAISKAPTISKKIDKLAESAASASRVSEATNAQIARLDKAEEVIRLSLAELSKARFALGLASIGQSTNKIPPISASNNEIQRFYKSQIKPLMPNGKSLDDKSLNDIINQWPSLTNAQDRLYLFEEALKER